MPSLEGQVIVVTGSTQGVGEAIALESARLGAAGVVVCGRNAENGKRVAEEVAGIGAESLFVEADLADVDATQSIIAYNDSPALGFDASINPYRGCEHGCIYCYARPTHEYLGLSAGLDFETKLFVKHDAPRLLRKAFASPSWDPQVVMLSGNTDAYQPVERRLRITRACLKVFSEYKCCFDVLSS